MVIARRRLGACEQAAAVVAKVDFSLTVGDVEVMGEEEIDTQQHVRRVTVTADIAIDNLHVAVLDGFCADRKGINRYHPGFV